MQDQPISESRYLLTRRLTEHRRARYLAIRDKFFEDHNDLSGLENLENWLTALDSAILMALKARTIEDARNIVDGFCIQSESILK